jgi:hypothetical protein
LRSDMLKTEVSSKWPFSVNAVEPDCRRARGFARTAGMW